MIKKVGIDIDGTITSVPSSLERLIVWLICKFPKIGEFTFGSFVRLLPVDRRAREIIRSSYKNGCKIIFITSRPIGLRWVTEHWLKWARIPYDQLVFNENPNSISLREFKRQKVKEYDIEILVDNSRRIREYVNGDQSIAITLKEFFKSADRSII